MESFAEVADDSLIELIEVPVDRETIEFLETDKSVRYVMWIRKDTPDALVDELPNSVQEVFADPEFQSDIARIFLVRK